MLVKLKYNTFYFCDKWSLKLFNQIKIEFCKNLYNLILKD